MSRKWVATVPGSLGEARQIYLFRENTMAPTLDAALGHRCFDVLESKLQLLSAYGGKMQSGMVRVLVKSSRSFRRRTRLAD